MPQSNKLHKSKRAANAAPRKLYILVMGLTGAGKSTFISVVTGNNDIPIGTTQDLEGVTQEVQDYVLCLMHEGKPYEVHLIDSPGFDDGTVLDAKVLSYIADYVNTTYMLKERLAGVLYLHDIMKEKMGSIAKRNLRMLEQMIGIDKLKNCTLVTTKWGCTNNPQAEETREEVLSVDKRYFGAMLQNQQHGQNAAIRRFDPKSKDTALSIIIPYLENHFTPHIAQQMVDPKGPKLPLGETEAGKVVAEGLEELQKANERLGEVEAANSILAQKFDEALFEDFQQKRKSLKRQIRLQRSGRWIMRTTIIGGAIVATVLTLGPGASAFVLEPAFEKAVRGQRREEKLAKERLEEEFKKKSQHGQLLKTTDARWLWDSKVKTLQDLDGEGYSIKSVSSEDILQVAKRGQTVGLVTDGTELENGIAKAGKPMDLDSDFSSEEDESLMSELKSLV